jgi:hypothetical protein
MIASPHLMPQTLRWREPDSNHRSRRIAEDREGSFRSSVANRRQFMGDQDFESAFLQRRINCEPDFPDRHSNQHRDPKERKITIAGVLRLSLNLHSHSEHRQRSSATAPGHCPYSLLPLIWPANDRTPMGSDAPRPVGTVGATNRTVVPTVMARIWLANSHSPVGADAPSTIDPIDTGGCVTRLCEHERAKSHHNGKHRCAISIEAQYSVFHFSGAFWI